MYFAIYRCYFCIIFNCHALGRSQSSFDTINEQSGTYRNTRHVFFSAFESIFRACGQILSNFVHAVRLCLFCYIQLQYVLCDFCPPDDYCPLVTHNRSCLAIICLLVPAGVRELPDVPSAPVLCC